jgi:hypothetical protein
MHGIGEVVNDEPARGEVVDDELRDEPHNEPRDALRHPDVRRRELVDDEPAQGEVVDDEPLDEPRDVTSHPNVRRRRSSRRRACASRSSRR